MIIKISPISFFFIDNCKDWLPVCKYMSPTECKSPYIKMHCQKRCKSCGSFMTPIVKEGIKPMNLIKFFKIEIT